MLSREESEAIDIDGGFEVGGVSITVIQVNGTRVRLGIDAPKFRSIHRREVQRAIAADAVLTTRAACIEESIAALKDQLAAVHQQIAEGARNATKTSNGRA